MIVSVGIDLSLVSPGIVIRNGFSTHAYFYANRKKDQNRSMKLEHNGGCFYLHPLPSCKSAPTTMIRYTTIVNDIIKIITAYPTTRIRLEGYAYNILSSSSSTLHELGGILKYQLHTHHRTWEEIPPTQLKKLFTGKGNATKNEMYQSFISKGQPDLLTAFDFKPSKCIPNPVQDIIDAYALSDSWNDNLKPVNL